MKKTGKDVVHFSLRFQKIGTREWLGARALRNRRSMNTEVNVILENEKQREERVRNLEDDRK